MPTSFMQNIPMVVELMQKLKPKKILDIGIGNGKYGLLAIEYIKDVRVDGIEAYEPYITDIQRSIYGKIYNNDISKMDYSKLAGYDLYLMIDVIEHVPKSVGHKILKGLNGVVLVSTPVEDYRAHYDNHFEDHVSHWTLEDFEQYPYEDYSNEFSTMVLVDTTAIAEKSTISKLRTRNKELENELKLVYGSRSWKSTEILRKVKSKNTNK